MARLTNLTTSRSDMFSKAVESLTPVGKQKIQEEVLEELKQADITLAPLNREEEYIRGFRDGFALAVNELEKFAKQLGLESNKK